MNFSEIYVQHVRDVHRFALYLSGNPALAEDLTSETFVHAWFGRAEIRVGTVKAYLFAIARNLYRDYLAREQRMAPSSEVPDRIDPAPGPDLGVEDREAFSNVLQAIQKLSDLHREALVLAIDQELSYEQIAAILGCSVAAVKVRIYRARLQLRAELEKKEQAWKT